MTATLKTATLLLCAALAQAATFGCGAVREKLGSPTLSACEQAVLILQPTQVRRRHERIARISTSCKHPRQCERHLRKRACELNADALIIESSGMTGDPVGPQVGSDGLPLHGGNAPAMNQRGADDRILLSASRAPVHLRSAVGVRWTEPGHGAFAGGAAPE